jgi:hypothetical protein
MANNSLNPFSREATVSIWKHSSPERHDLRPGEIIHTILAQVLACTGWKISVVFI